MTLKGESFSGTYLFQATSLTSQARRIAATRFASDALVGKWDIQFKNGVRKQYLVEKSGVVRDGATRMRLLHLADGGYLIVTPRDTLQVVRSISGGKLAIRYYTLATARFPEMPTTIGTATRAGNSDKKK